MLTIDIPTTVSNERIADMVITAFEGGSNHWIRKVSPRADKLTTENPWYSDPTFYEGQFGISIWADDELHVLTHENAKRGFELMAEQFETSHWADFLEQNEDADTADVWLQLCLFGEVVYG